MKGMLVMKRGIAQFSAFASVVGLALALVGGLMFITSRPVSEDESVQQAARITVGPNGEKMHAITGAELHQAAQQRQTANAARAGKRQMGIILGISGVVLLFAAIAAGLLAKSSANTQG